MDPPRLVVNAKAYPDALSGTGMMRLLQAAEEASTSAGRPIALAVPATQLARVAGEARRVVVMAQHTDPHQPGAATGWLPVEAVQAAGARGSLVNHAEHKLPHADVARIVARLGAAGLSSLVCADGPAEVAALAALAPTMLAVEPPQLIGGNVSVTTADPAVVQDAVRDVVRRSPTTRTLCGAGVKDGRDAAKAIALGAYGVLVASGVVKAADPETAMLDLLRGMP